MIILLVLVVVVAVGFFTASAARERGAPGRSVFAAALRLGAGVALVRLMIFYGGLSLFGDADERQALGYILILLNSVVEFGVASALNRARPGPPLLVAVLIGLTSFLLGFAWAWLRSQPRSGTPA